MLDLMPEEYDDMPGVLAALFASLLDEEPWAAFLDRLSKASGATWVTLILTPRAAEQPGMILTPNADPGVGADYSSRLFADDPFIGLPDGKVEHFRDFVSATMLDRKTAFREFVEHTSDEILGVDIGEASRLELRLRLTRAADQPRFTIEDRRKLEKIVPHLRIALALFERLAAGETEQRIYAGAVAQMAVGLIILDRKGKVLRLNAPASTILAEQDGIALRNGALSFDDAALGRQLQDRLARGEDGAPMTIRIERPSGTGDLLLVAGQAPAPDFVSAGGGPALVLFLTDPTHGPRISAEAIRDLLGLTQGEAAVAAHLAEGLAPAEVAARLGISANTVRAHLRSIFGKTGVKRQSQLVQLVHQSLPSLSRPAG
ncbi:MAG: helix-turn-helix transcriptional regulator [Alphaproteobacteria bacterium]|jgi:DNA-binding CsgD family transcriptional regulator